MTHRSNLNPVFPRHALPFRSLLAVPALFAPPALFTLPAVLALASCGPEPEDRDTVPTATTADPAAPPATGGEATLPSSTVPTPPASCLNTTTPNEDGQFVLLADPANNYRFSSELDITLTSVAPNTDLSFDWSGLTQDFFGHQVDPLADIDTILVVLWALTPEEVAIKLNADELGAAYSKGPMVIYTQNMVTSGSTRASETNPTITEDFKVPGDGGGPLPHHEVMGRFDPAEWDPATHSYTVLAQEGGTLGEGVRMVHAFQLDPNSTNTEISITPDSASLTYDTSLVELTPVQMPVGVNTVLVDWSEMRMNALGRPFLPRSVDQVLVAKYTQTPEQLRAEFLDLELIAQEMYRGDVLAGSELALDGLVDEAGQPFTGITADGTWILALMCSTCGNPAPWFLTVLSPCP